MFVNAVTYTEKPLSVIASMAGVSYGLDDAKLSRAEKCFKAGHLSVFEHAHFACRITGISRACTHQLVRHRHLSFTQRSQRYSLTDPECIVPYTVSGQEDLLDDYTELVEQAQALYRKMVERKIPMEDARYILPEGTSTDICVSGNLRAWTDFFDLRLDSHAQWEIRGLAWNVFDTMYDLGGEWKTFCSWYETYRLAKSENGEAAEL